jgi:hypothetical protein
MAQENEPSRLDRILDRIRIAHQPARGREDHRTVSPQEKLKGNLIPMVNPPLQELCIQKHAFAGQAGNTPEVLNQRALRSCHRRSRI